MLRFSIRDLLWLIVVVGLSLALWNERKASLNERWEKECAIYWSKSLQRSIEYEGFIVGGSTLGCVDLIPVGRDQSADNRP